MLRCTLAILLAVASLGACRNPNIVFILTDDQDVHMGAAEHMPNLQVSQLN